MTVAVLVPHMLEAFLASDAGFRKARKALKASQEYPEDFCDSLVQMHCVWLGSHDRVALRLAVQPLLQLKCPSACCRVTSVVASFFVCG